MKACIRGNPLHMEACRAAYTGDDNNSYGCICGGNSTKHYEEPAENGQSKVY